MTDTNQSQRMPTAVDVAKRAGVSTATVSRTFNDPSKVVPAIREKVEAAAAALGWVPHGAGSALARRRTLLAGALIPTLANGIFASHINAMQEQMQRGGMTLLIGVTNHDPKQTLHNVRSMMARGVEALALVGASDGEEVYAAIRSRKIPYVLTHGFQEHSPHHMIGCDNYRVMFEMTRLLIEQGHTSFAVVTPPRLNNDRVNARVEGIRDALSAQGLGLRPDHFCEGPWSIEFGRNSLNRILGTTHKRPTAVICGNDVIALGVIMEARRLGLDVPGHLAVTGFNNDEIASQFDPGITTVQVDNDAIGRATADHLLECLSGKDPAPAPPIAAKIIIRGSTHR